MKQQSCSRSAPPVQTINTVMQIIEERASVYRNILVLVIVATIALFIFSTLVFTARATVAEWSSWLPKIVSLATAGAGIFPLKSYFKWRGLHLLCQNYRELVVAHETTTKINDEILATVSNKFWDLYNTTWEN